MMATKLGLPARLAVVAVGLVLIGIGVWALVDPASFFARLAVFPPYNSHFIHDLGSFELGLGLALWLALVWSDALLVVLAANAVAASVHVGAHVADRNLGGNPGQDISLLSLLALGLIVGAALRFRQMRA